MDRRLMAISPLARPPGGPTPRTGFPPLFLSLRQDGQNRVDFFLVGASQRFTHAGAGGEGGCGAGRKGEGGKAVRGSAGCAVAGGRAPWVRRRAFCRLPPAADALARRPGRALAALGTTRGGGRCVPAEKEDPGPGTFRTPEIFVGGEGRPGKDRRNPTTSPVWNDANEKSAHVRTLFWTMSPKACLIHGGKNHGQGGPFHPTTLSPSVAPCGTPPPRQALPRCRRRPRRPAAAPASLRPGCCWVRPRWGTAMRARRGVFVTRHCQHHRPGETPTPTGTNRPRPTMVQKRVRTCALFGPSDWGPTHTNLKAPDSHLRLETPHLTPTRMAVPDAGHSSPWSRGRGAAVLLQPLRQRRLRRARAACFAPPGEGCRTGLWGWIGGPLAARRGQQAAGSGRRRGGGVGGGLRCWVRRGLVGRWRCRRGPPPARPSAAASRTPWSGR